MANAMHSRSRSGISSHSISACCSSAVRYVQPSVSSLHHRVELGVLGLPARDRLFELTDGLKAALLRHLHERIALVLSGLVVGGDAEVEGGALVLPSFEVPETGRFDR